MSSPSTPATSVNLGPESTQPSSPVEDVMDRQARSKSGESAASEANGILEENSEGMDVKAKALMHLLKTSSVCIARTFAFVCLGNTSL